MIRLSSNWTLFLKIFLPVFWISFFGGFLIAVYTTNSIQAPQFSSGKFRSGAVIFVLSGMIFFLFTFFRIKRIDADDKFIYISNYFRTYRYTFDAIEKITVYDHLILKAAHLKFKGKTSLGRKIVFLPVMDSLREFCNISSIEIEEE